MGLGGALVFLVVVGLVWHTTRRGLAPARRLAAALDAVSVDDPPAGLDVGEMPVELAPMRDTSDALIRRAVAALQRERRTTADIAHQLRTPISEILTVSEVALRGGAQNGSATRALGTTRDVAWRMGRAVSTLLQLARLEGGTDGFEEAAVPVGAVAREQLRSLAALERERGLTVQLAIDEEAVILGSREVVEIVLGNLLSNALYYAPEGSTVHCTLTGEGPEWRLAVDNEAPGIRPEDLEALTQPFWRKERERTDGDRSGLGLALSTALSERTGTELRFELEAGRLVAALSRSAA